MERLGIRFSILIFAMLLLWPCPSALQAQDEAVEATADMPADLQAMIAKAREDGANMFSTNWVVIKARKDMFSHRKDWRGYGERLEKNIDGLRANNTDDWNFLEKGVNWMRRQWRGLTHVLDGRREASEADSIPNFDDMTAGAESGDEGREVSDQIAELSEKGDLKGIVGRIYKEIKWDCVKQQHCYPPNASDWVQGLHPYHYHLLLDRIAKDKIKFFYAIQFLKEMFAQPEIAKVIGTLDKGLSTLDKKEILTGYMTYRAKRADDTDVDAVKAALSYLSRLAVDFNKRGSESDKALAYLFATMYEMMDIARNVTVIRNKMTYRWAANELYAMYMDYQWIALRMRKKDQGEESEGEDADERKPEDVVRDALEGPGPFDDPENQPQGETVRTEEGVDGRTETQRSEAGTLFLKNLESFRDRIDGIIEKQRAALLIMDNWEKHRDQAGAERELRRLVYGSDPSNPSPGSLEYMLHDEDPRLDIMLVALRKAYEENDGFPNDPAVKAAYEEMLGKDWKVVRDTQEKQVIPFLQKLDRLGAETQTRRPDGTTIERPTTPSEVDSRRQDIDRMLDTGTDNRGRPLSEQDRQALSAERSDLSGPSAADTSSISDGDLDTMLNTGRDASGNPLTSEDRSALEAERNSRAADPNASTNTGPLTDPSNGVQPDMPAGINDTSANTSGLTADTNAAGRDTPVGPSNPVGPTAISPNAPANSAVTAAPPSDAELLLRAKAAVAAQGIPEPSLSHPYWKSSMKGVADGLIAAQMGKLNAESQDGLTINEFGQWTGRTDTSIVTADRTPDYDKYDFWYGNYPDIASQVQKQAADQYNQKVAAEFAKLKGQFGSPAGPAGPPAATLDNSVVSQTNAR